MRAVVVFVALAALCSVASAKFVSVTGDGVILTTPPSNVFNQPTLVAGTLIPDLDGPRRDGKLLIGAFDEKQNVLLTEDLVLNPSVTLKAGRRYDSHFVFFHQQSSFSESLSAAATFTTDNRFVGCTSNDGTGSNGLYEIETTPTFGLPSVLYPTTTFGARGYENGDFAVGSGTSFTNTLSISQPGDYVRCISATCTDAAGDNCACSFNPTPTICIQPQFNGGAAYRCFGSVNEVIVESNSGFNSTCFVDAATQVFTLASCTDAEGCYPRADGVGFCLKSGDAGGFSSVKVRATAGCGCDDLIIVSVPILSSGRCLPPNFDPPAPGCPTTTVAATATSAEASTTTENCVCLKFDA